VEVAADIPDLFAQKAAAKPLEKAPAPVTPAEAAPVPTTPVPELAPGSSYSEIFNEPGKKEWPLNEVTRRTAALPGVAGAIIATSDGLLVAGKWPDGTAPEAVAGFVPQMHGRMLQYSKELKLGEPGSFTFTIGAVPLQIFKTGNCYLTILGRAGEALPERQLAALARHLTESSNAK
jgi:predicted regulator of Ras-like GTPase activity (Roadblock/LC7/MglB family)